MDTDNNVGKARGKAGAGWREAKKGKIGNISNTVNNKSKQTNK